MLKLHWFTRSNQLYATYIAASWFKTVDKGTSDSTRKVMLGLFIWRHYQVLRKGIRTETTLRHSWKGRHGNHMITIPYTE